MADDWTSLQFYRMQRVLEVTFVLSHLSSQKNVTKYNQMVINYEVNKSLADKSLVSVNQSNLH